MSDDQPQKSGTCHCTSSMNKRTGFYMVYMTKIIPPRWSEPLEVISILNPEFLVIGEAPTPRWMMMWWVPLMEFCVESPLLGSIPLVVFLQTNANLM